MISDFYKSVLPAMGVRVLAVFKGGLKAAPTHYFYETDEELLDAADTYNGLGKNVYHACAAYNEPTNRKGDNVLAIKALWVDEDVGPTKPYATQKAAAQHFEEFRIALGLPKSHVVSSGGGVHQYLPFSKAIYPAQWDRLAALFAQCLDHYGVKHDTSRTEDKASILRIPGTHNFKTNPAKAVTLKRMGEEVPAAELWKILKAYAEANGLIVDAKAPKGKPAETNDIIGNRLNYPPSVGDIVAGHCAVLADVADSGGHCSYDTWWKAMGIAKHTTEPEAVAVFWTRNRESTGHEKFDGIKIMTEWSAGPTTCANFAKDDDAAEKCAKCKFNGKVTSPIQLGVPAVPPMATTPAPAAQAVPGREWTFKAPWILAELNATTHIGFGNDGSMTRSVLQPDGTYAHRPFCNRYWQVMRRVRMLDGTWQLEIAYEQYANKPPQTFLLPSSMVLSAEKMKERFSSFELYIYGGAAAMQKAQDVVIWEQNQQYALEQEVATYPTMGWVTEEPNVRSDKTGTFILGDMMIAPKPALPEKVLLGDTVTANIRRAFRSKGTTAEWVSIIDQVYNRPRAEAYQFLIAASFASPLVSLVPGGGEWHGIPVVVTGDSGAAKTTSCLVAMSVYGYGQNLKFNASAGQGDTINALSVKLGSLRNLPCILDEMSGLTAEKISDIFSMIANGTMKDRMKSSGGLNENPYFWDLIPLVNTNDKMHEVLEGLRSQHSTKAMQLRSFEVEIASSDLRTIFKDVNKTMIEQDLLDENYGCVGEEWLQFIANNRVAIQEELGRQRAAYMIDPADESNIRFYKDLLVTVRVAAMLARKKGFIGWDVGAMIKWAESKLLVLRDSVAVTNWDATISDFVASYHGRTIVTRDMKLGPGRRSKHVELPLEPISVNAVPVARKAIEAKRFVFTVNSMKDWAQKNRIMHSTLLAEMIARDLLVGGVVGETKLVPLMINVGSGTSITRPQAPCYELNYDKVAYFDAEDSADMSNVVPMPVAAVPSEPVAVPEGATNDAATI